ncbi:uncharacterized protein [Arachis hypogaea]|uniref:uncharacterized protein n=1 Tax=Arachis hypogaea TaxID=3818 RepID=UPI003B2146AC
MAAIGTNTKNSQHSRHNSLPNAPHPLVSQLEEHLQRLKTSEATISSSSVRHKLDGLRDLHDCADKLIQLPIEQKALAQECSNKQIDELLEGSLKLLDICSTAKDFLVQSKENMLEIQSVIRRKRGDGSNFTAACAEYLTSRKTMKKTMRKSLENLKTVKNDGKASSSSKDNNSSSMLTTFKEAEDVTLSSLECLLLLISGPRRSSKGSKWSLISKLMQPKRIACDSQESDMNEFEKVDADLHSLISHKPSSIDNFQINMENLEIMEASKTKSNFHARSNSLPSRPHPLILQCNEHLERLRSSNETSSSSSSSLRYKLGALQDLHECVENLVQLPLTQDTLLHEPQENCVDELLDGSLRLLDVCTSAKDSLLHTKECIRELQSVIRRKRGGEEGIIAEANKFLNSRKVVKKAIVKALLNLKPIAKNIIKDQQTLALVGLLKDVEVVTLSIFESLLHFISGTSSSNVKHGTLSLVSKLIIHTKRTTRSCSYESEFSQVDAALLACISNKNMSEMQNQLEKLESCIHDLEEGLEFMFRRLIKTRVALLNILNH